MVKLLHFIVLTALFSGTSYSQIYLKPQVRYHLPLTYQEAPEFFNAAIVVATGNGYYYTYIITENEDFSLAKGPAYGGTIGFMLNDHIGIETGIHYFQQKKEIKSEDVFPHYPIGSTSWQFRTINATPSLVISHTTGKLTITAKTGFLGGLTSLGRSVFFEGKRKTYKFNKSLSTGYTFGMDFGIRITNAVSINAEAGIENLFYKPRKGLLQYDDFTYYKFDELPVYLKEIIYVKEIDNQNVYYDNESDTYFTDYNKPLMRLKETLKLNSFYTGIGIRFNFISR
ncbi:MAG TPA: hypothetical protein VHI78_05445 [Bacteroidales bacterium]|nr:hypothetical protein [Bacteroidales bacterium]